MRNSLNLTRGDIPKLVRQVAIPASVGFFFNTMYNVVDTYFGGLISTETLAALSLSLPVFFIIIALGTGVSTGATALIATEIGAGREKEAGFLSLQALGFGLLTGILITIAGLLASPFLFQVLGAKDQYLTISLAYMSTIFYGGIFFITVNMFNAILQAQGDTRSFRNFLIVGFLLNVILDPWLIYGGLGVPALHFSGIALATVIVQVIGCVYLAHKVRRSGLLAGMAIRDLVPRLGVYREIARQGLPASINMATVGIGIFVITYFVSRFGQDGVAAYGAAMRVEQIALLPTIGLNVATLTIVAQNHGAHQYERIRETLSTVLKYGAVVMLAGAAAVFALSRPLMSVFSHDPEVIRIGATYLKIDALVFYAYVILFVNVSALQGVKRPMFAVWMGLYRQIVAPVAVFYFLSSVLGWGLPGIWWGIFFVTWSAALAALAYARWVFGRMYRPSSTPETPVTVDGV